MAGTPFQPALMTCTVTVPGSPTSLLALIKALGGRYANAISSSAGFSAQADPNNTDDILIGDETVAVSPQSCGVYLTAGAAESDSARIPYTAPVGSFWVVSKAGGSPLLNIVIFQ